MLGVMLSPTSNDVDVELLVASLRSELDETRRRLDSFDARLEAKLGKALATFQDVASAQTKDTIDELVRKEEVANGPVNVELVQPDLLAENTEE